MKRGRRTDLGPDGLYGFLKNLLPKSKFTITDLIGLANDELHKNGLSPIPRQSAGDFMIKMREEGLVEIVGVSKKPRSFIAKSNAKAEIVKPAVEVTPVAPANVAKLMAEIGGEIEVETAVAKTAVIGRKIAERIADLDRMKNELAQLLAGDVYAETRQKFERLNEEINALTKSAGGIICLGCKKNREQMATDRVVLFEASNRLKAREARLVDDALRGGPASVIHSR